jgi:endonuclease YncB( thermonuclease family)
MRVLVLALCALAMASVPAEARSGSCLLPGVTVRCSLWSGKVTYITDADTIHVRLGGDQQRVVTVRFTGINAMEQTVYSADPRRRRGACHAVAATGRTEQMIRRGGWRVRLAAMDASSTSRKRWRRAVAVRYGGRWHDIGRALVAEGHALWLPNANEWLWNASYSALAERAAAAHRRLWDPTSCGRGPQDGIALRMEVNGDADGIDEENVNGEWLRIRNLDRVREIHLGGWTLGDSTPRRYAFPAWVTVPPGEELAVRVGRGIDTWTEVFWGLKAPIFGNTDASGHGVGDGAFLFDPDGDLRAWTTYPCRLACADPYQGALELAVNPLGREFVTVRNAGSSDVDLDGYRLWSPPHVYAFDRATALAPGEQLKLQVVGDPDEDARLLKYWGKAGSILNNRGDVVRLTNLRGTVLDCVAYGDRTC